MASPDGEYFFFVSWSGDLDSDAAVSEISVYRARTVIQELRASATGPTTPLPPYRRVVLRSQFPVPAISGAMWDPDGRAVLFLGVTEEGSRQAHRLDVQTGALDRLTNLPYRFPDTVTRFSARGEAVLFEASVRNELPPPHYPAEWVERREDGSIWREVALRLRDGRKETFYTAYRGQTARPLALGRGVLQWESVRFSVDGRMALGTYFRRDPAGQVIASFVRIDLEKGEFAPLAGIGISADRYQLYPGSRLRRPGPELFWSADGSRVILVSATALPSTSTGGGKDETPYITEYEVGSGRWRHLQPLMSAGSPESAGKYVSAVGWLKSGQELLVTHEVNGHPAEGTVYSFTASGVQSRTVGPEITVPDANAALVEGLSVKLVQDANIPPRMVASLGSDEVALTAPDPALAAVQLQRMEPFPWKEGDKTVTGGLVLPRGFSRGQPVPLVIQTYYYEPVVFLPDGPNSASDAAQALAARGLAVLQIDGPGDDPQKPIAEGPELVVRIDAAVEALAQKGIVDATRVGLTGFSRGGYQMLYAITHPGRVRLAAAVGADFFNGTYVNYLTDVGGYGRGGASLNSYETGPGGTFWKKKAEWLEYEPSFNADRILTPLLISGHGSGRNDDKSAYGRDSISALGLVGAFALNEKPLDYLYLPDSGHQLIRPLERLALMEAVVDWMAFWLQGYEDPSPHKALLYARWRPLREQQARSVARAQAGRNP